jgi:hypothetical protein
MTFEQKIELYSSLIAEHMDADYKAFLAGLSGDTETFETFSKKASDLKDQLNSLPSDVRQAALAWDA